MLRWSLLAMMALFSAPRTVQDHTAALAVHDGPGFTADGLLKYPAAYREWIFLSAGLDMSYTAPPPGPPASAAGTAMPRHSVFNNVFVNPAAWRAYMATGHWPEGTVLVLENRGAQGDHSINVRGRTQSEEITGLEVHARDARLPGGWAFYSFKDEKPAPPIAATAGCTTCHQQHAAVDTTFVQFYPTLMPVAKARGTLSENFLKDEAAKKP